jgi:hypothetical protein
MFRGYKAESIVVFIEDQAFSPCRMIWFLNPPPPLSPSPVSKFSLFLSDPLCRRGSSLLTGGLGWGWGRSQILRRRESLVLYKSFNCIFYELRGHSGFYYGLETWPKRGGGGVRGFLVYNLRPQPMMLCKFKLCLDLFS